MDKVVKCFCVVVVTIFLDCYFQGYDVKYGFNLALFGYKGIKQDDGASVLSLVMVIFLSFLGRSLNPTHPFRDQSRIS